MYEGVVSRAVALCKGGQMAFSLDHEYFTQNSYVESQDPTITASAQCANAAASLADPSQFRRRARRTVEPSNRSPPPYTHTHSTCGHPARLASMLVNSLHTIDMSTFMVHFSHGVQIINADADAKPP